MNDATDRTGYRKGSDGYATRERTWEQQIGDIIDAYDDFCADGMDRETAKEQAVQWIARLFRPELEEPIL